MGAATVNEVLMRFLAAFKDQYKALMSTTMSLAIQCRFEPQYGIQTYYYLAYTPAERGSNKRFNPNLRYFTLEGLVLNTLVLKN